MTPEELTQLVLDGDVTGLVEALAPLDESQRRKLSKCAQQLRRRLERGEEPDPSAAQAGAWLENLKLAVGGTLTAARRLPQGYRRYTAADLAVLGVGPLSAAKRLQGFYFDDADSEALLRVLRDRRADWLDAWVAHQLEQEWTPFRWTLLRELIRCGACSKPDVPGYARLFANQMHGWRRRGEPPPPPLHERLRADPELLQDEVWRLFEVETNAFTWDLEGTPHAPEGYESWSTAFVKLAESGDLDRARLLDASLAALTTGFGANVLSGFHKLHTRLAPSVDEIAEREDAYRHLLGSPVGHVASFGLKHLGSLEKARRLDGKGLLEAVGAVFALSAKGAPTQALKLVKRVARRDESLEPAAARAAAEALAHPSADVQELALELIESLTGDAGAAPEDLELVLALRERVAQVAPALQSRVQALLSRSGDADSAETREEFAREASDRLAELRERIAALDPELRARVGLADATDRMPPPLAFEIAQAAVLSATERVAPIESLEELIDAVAHAVEEVDSADEVERILDALSRLCDQRPDDFGLRTQAVAKRIAEPVQSDVPRGIASSWGGTPVLLQDLLLTWITGYPRTSHQTLWYRSAGAYPFVEYRLRELTLRVLRRRAAPLLSAPTHRHGWIEPMALVDRLRSLPPHDDALLRSDWIQALLRLAPDGRPEALAAAAMLEGDVGRMLRFALGGDDAPADRDPRDVALWIAAGRARDPRGSLAGSLAPFATLELGPDAIQPAQYTWTAESVQQREGDRDVSRPRLTLRVTPPAPAWDGDWESRTAGGRRRGAFVGTLKYLASRGARALGLGPEQRLSQLPTVALHRAVDHSWQTPDLHAPWLIRWLSMIWPLQADAAFATGVRALFGRIDMDSAATAPNFAHVEPLFEPDRPWSELGILALWLSLLVRDADARGLAVDALVEGIEDGRAHPAPLADVLCRLAESGVAKPNRLTESLTRVADVSPLHRLVVAEILEALIARGALPARGLHQPLALLHDASIQLGRPVGAHARPQLEAIRGSGKAAKLARALLALEPHAECAEQGEALAQALESRLLRAQRWSACASHRARPDGCA
jgi:hypothetical protein